MTRRICARETEVLALVSIGQWPRQAGVDLLAHVASCGACAETVAVAAALRDLEDDDALPRLPDARAVWQHAQWQARQDAMRRAARPVAAMQTLAALVTLVTTVGVVAWTSDTFAFGDRLSALGLTVWASMGSAATRAVAVADAATLPLELPAGLVWLLTAVAGLGLTAIGVAVALSTLADLGRGGKGSAGTVGSAGPLGPSRPSGPS